MTSPLSSLGKIRRMPLQMQKSRKKTAHIKESIQNEDELAMMDKILGPGAQIPVSSCSKGTSSQSAAAPSDMELMTSMMQKITSLEHKVKQQAQAIQHREKKIKELEEEIQVVQKGSEKSPASDRTKELEDSCVQLQQQIWEMERFLNDYGLIWVGEGPDSSDELEPLIEERVYSRKNTWTPEDNILSGTPINLDLIFENLKDLNILAGEGESKVEHTTGGARLKQRRAIPLTFYQNGIVMFNGPFRPYEEPSTQRCLRDIMDGYFPSELQRRYPDGVPFQVTDKRDVFFQERKLPESFPGVGQAIGHSKANGLKETKEIPGSKLTMEQFLNKLPKSVIRDGHVIDVRGEIKNTLQGTGGNRNHEVVLVETPSLAAMKKRLDQEGKKEKPSSQVTTLRVKSEDAEKIYVIKMAFTETIGDLRRHLDRCRGSASEPYEILSTFPKRVYNDTSMTLEECGLVPNASLLLRKKMPLAKPSGQ
ncbi:UBX domain-containing protein 11 isoform X2 [Anolis carolinensis]|uniref:UBX domain-containing protein 11 isoform X2 n=1 Tax=Anolis carolinensis TaxID=28377 RepID=UPI000462B656|nr:PREDICTED: UBX domain-containing protein 11 [Anolis carolinensis]|eukprot:XP_003227417.2 PREDICTED: UBX domain-containing protein 11 [Anolis carolinensis]